MRPRRVETRAGCEPSWRRTLQIPRWPRPTASGVRGTPVFPRRAPCVSARFRLPGGLSRSGPFSVRAPEPRLPMADGNCELKGSAPASLRFHPDSSTLAFDHFLADRETDAGAGDFAAVQAFEHAEHPVGVLRIDTHSVVAHREQPAFRVSLRGDMDSRCFLAAVLNRIGDKILEDLHQRDFFGYQSR